MRLLRLLVLLAGLSALAISGTSCGPPTVQMPPCPSCGSSNVAVVGIVGEPGFLTLECKDCGYFEDRRTPTVVPGPAGPLHEVEWLGEEGPLVLGAVYRSTEGILVSTVAVVDLDGNRTAGLAVPDGVAHFFAASPDGKQIVFSRRRAPEDESDVVTFPGIDPKEAGDRQWRRWRTDADLAFWGPARSLRFAQQPGMNVYAEWSPDGREVAFLRPVGEGDPDADRGIWALNISSGEARPLSRKLEESEEVGHAYGAPRWSPDATLVAFTIARNTPEMEHDIWLTAADGSGDRRLTSVGDVYRGSIAWRSDGKEIRFIRAQRVSVEVGWDVQQSLWSVDVSTGIVRRLLSWKQLRRPDPLAAPRMSPESERVAVVTRDEEEPWVTKVLWVVEVDSAAAAQVVSGPGIGSVAWSPDASKLAYVIDGSEVWVADRERNWEAELLTVVRSEGGALAFGPP